MFYKGNKLMNLQYYVLYIVNKLLYIIDTEFLLANVCHIASRYLSLFLTWQTSLLVQILHGRNIYD